MFFTNEKLKIETREYDWGKINQVCLGENGRGRKLLALTVPGDVKDAIVPGLRTDLSIGLTKSGKYRIVAKEDKEMYLFLSTQGGYTRHGSGYFSATNTEGIEVLARGNGADGDAGRIGSWDVALIKVTVPYAVIRVRRSGAMYDTPSEFCVVHDGTVTYFANPEEYAEWADATGHDVEGFTIIFDKHPIDLDAWHRL